MGNPKLEAANQRLKDGGVGFKIYQRGSKLSLRGMFPPQPGEEKPKQRWLSLDIYANPAGIKRAEAEARKVASAIALKEFNWGDYINLSLDPTDETPPTIEYVSAEFEKDYFAVRGRTEKTATTWRTDYEAVFKKFAPGSHVTAEALLNIILSTEANTRTRLRACTACSAIAKFINLDFDAKRYRGNYSTKQVQPRDIPSDELIEQRYERLTNPRWKWVFGIMACYGLRNHEVFHIDPDSLQKPPGILQVTAGKTGERRVFPIYPEWWEDWKLWEVKLPEINGKNNQDLSGRVCRYFKRHELGLPLNLRHAWAIRSMLFGMDVSMAAAQMGHSVKLHCETYHQWITEDQQMKAFRILMERPDRPVSPGFGR